MKDELKIALVQTHLHWEDPTANRVLFAEKINGISESIDLVVLPEMFTTGFTMKPENIDSLEGKKTVDWMLKMAKEHQTALAGSIVYEEHSKFFNRLFFVTPDGEYKTYDKKHTFTLAGEHQVYTAGKTKPLFKYHGFSICPLICYDLRFPVWSRNTSNYDLLIYVANWPKVRTNAWDALLKARAIENMAYCVGVNRIGEDGVGHEYSGHSAVYDVLGNRIAYSEKEEILYATLSKAHIEEQRKKLRFLEDRDDFKLL